MDSYQKLASAIICRAAEDYVKAVKAGKTVTISECEVFFRSRWFSCLTEIDGEYLLRRLKDTLSAAQSQK